MCCSGGSALVLDGVPDLSEDNYFAYPKGQGPWHTCKADGYMEPRVAAEGSAGPDCPPSTISKLLQNAAKIKGKRDALLVERPLPKQQDKRAPPPLEKEKWTCWNYENYHTDVRRSAKAFIKLGYGMHDTVNVWGFNSPEWIIAAQAGIYAGGKIAGIYPTDTAATVAFKIVHSGGAIIALESKSLLDKVVEALNKPDLNVKASKIKAFVCWGYEPEEKTVTIEGNGEVPVLSWKDMLSIGDKEADEEVNARLEKTKPGNCCSLIYTSGTTGDPKAVMMSHDSMIFEIKALMKAFVNAGIGASADEERVLSYLPISHIAGCALDLMMSTVLSGTSESSVAVYFARPYDLKLGTIKDRLSVAQPTLFLGVPLVWEKMADKIRDIAVTVTGVKKKLADWAKGKCLEHAKNTLLGGSGAKPFGHGMAMKIMNGVKEKVGLHKTKAALTGAAPIRVDTLEFYSALGIYINEVYGMSETCAASTISLDEAHMWGSCGFQLSGVEVKIFRVSPGNFNDKAECPRAENLQTMTDEVQGEICMRGRSMMMGYMACSEMGPEHMDEINKKNSECIDDDGWVHSGDKGLKTKAGMVKITGRYKELIIGAGGENIAPVPIEDSVKGLCAAVAECMMIGDKRKYNVSIITLKAVGANGDTPGTDVLESAGKRVKDGITTISQALDDDDFIKHIASAVNKTNKNEKIVPNNPFKIQKFTILPLNFSEENEELTPTKKLKRAVVEKKYKELIDHMYATDGQYIRFKAFS